MHRTVTLPPGIYQLVPCGADAEDPRTMCVPLDPEACFVREDDDSVIEFAPLDEIGIDPLHGKPDHYLIRIDLDVSGVDGDSIQTPHGPLSISDTWLLSPAASTSTNPHPGEQYATNWFAFTLLGEVEVAVDGPAICIGDMRIDLSILGDVETTVAMLDGVEREWNEIVACGRTADAVHASYVARHGGPVNAILSEMPRTHDDGVMVILTFDEGQVERLEALDALECPEAAVFARSLRGQMERGYNHDVFRPAFS